MRKLPVTISESEFLEGLKKVNNDKLRLAFMLGFYQCMRISEIVGLRKEESNCCRAEVDKVKTENNGKKITIYKCFKCLKELKTSDFRRSKTEWQIYPLTKENIELNKGYIHIKNAKGSVDRDIPIMKPVIKGLKHLPIEMGIRNLEKQIKNYWPTLHFHSLRHAGSTMYLNDKKIDIRFIQQLLGHSNLSTTQIYTHVNPSQLKTAFEDVWKE